jgi:hypothetical protein
VIQMKVKNVQHIRPATYGASGNCAANVSYVVLRSRHTVNYRNIIFAHAKFNQNKLEVILAF